GLVVDRGEDAWVQPCKSPVWDTALALLALEEADRVLPDAPARAGIGRAFAWLRAKQVLDGAGDWRESRPELPPGGWPFQFGNSHYPDLDDTAAVAWAMQDFDAGALREPLRRALDWLKGMQSKNGGFASFDADNTFDYLNDIPFADHG